MAVEHGDWVRYGKRYPVNGCGTTVGLTMCFSLLPGQSRVSGEVERMAPKVRSPPPICLPTPSPPALGFISV